MSEGSPEWLLDTAAISYLQRGQSPWATRVMAFPAGDRLVPVIVVEEQMRGRLAQIRSAESKGDRQRLLLAYSWLKETAGFFADVAIVPFDEAALTLYEDLRRVHRHLGSQDLKIAAIALARDAVLVTPNIADFGRVPGLRVEDWSQ